MEELNTDSSLPTTAERKKEGRGVIILALGHYNYGLMAFNLALSIKNLSPDTKICVVHAGNGLSRVSEANRNKYFDEVIECPQEYIAGGNFIRAKVHLLDLTPFHKTLYLDADMIWSNHLSIENLFAELSNSEIKFSCINEGYVNITDGTSTLNEKYTFWAELNDIKKAYIENKNFRNGNLYQLRTELMYFVNCREVKKMFRDAKNIYDGHSIPVKRFGIHTPDEFAFNIAACMNNLAPHKEKWMPVYWHYRHFGMRIDQHQILKRFYAYSIGGSVMQDTVKKQYDILAKALASKFGIQSPYLAKAKRDFVPERK